MAKKQKRIYPPYVPATVWQPPLIECLSEAVLDSGAVEWRVVDVEKILQRLTREDLDREVVAEQVGFQRILDYKPAGMAKFLNKVRLVFEGKLNDLGVRTKNETEDKEPAVEGGPPVTCATELPVAIKTVVVLHLDQADYMEHRVWANIQEYTRKVFGDLLVDLVDIKPLGDGWFDLLIEHKITIAAYTEALSKFSWIEGVATKPARLYGKDVIRIERRKCFA